MSEHHSHRAPRRPDEPIPFGVGEYGTHVGQDGGLYYGPPSYGHRAPARKRRRIFLWIFLAVQALFLIWVITGAASGHSAAVHCHDQVLTHAQCASATNAGTAIGVVLVIVFWMVVDVILGVSYGVYRLATRDR